MPKHPRSSYPSRRDRTYFSNRRLRLGCLFNESAGPTNNGGGGTGPVSLALPSFVATESGDVTLTHTVSNVSGGGATPTAWLRIDGSNGSSETTTSDRVTAPSLTNSYTFTLVAGVEYTISVGNGGGSATDLHTIVVKSN